MKKIKLFRFLVVLSILFSTMSCTYYDYIFAENVTESTTILIKENSDYETVLEQIKPYLKDIESFKWVAEKKKYPYAIKSGRYKINKGENNNTIINRLRGGRQETVDVKLGYEIKTTHQLAKMLAKNLSFTQEDFLEALSKKDFIQSSELKDNEQLIFFIPDTYEFYWSISADRFIDKMKKEYDKFWTDENRQKAKELGLTVLEVNILASIVQYETDKSDEQPKVAGLYLNRLKNSIRLQADPTVKYAVMQKNGFNTTVKRIYHKDLFLVSPFNTYRNLGLPPTPIGLATKQALTSVLHSDKHNYLYMCADPSRPGYHLFEKDYDKHLINAKKYSNWANENGIN
jgi:UPF0755 protein